MPDKTGTRRDENARATRRVLLETGRKLFTERGFAGTGIEEIALAAGVTTGALYHHFGNKLGLFREVAVAIEVETMDRALALGADLTDPWQALEAGIEQTLEGSLEPDVQQILLRDAPNVLGAAEYRELGEKHSFGMLRDAVEGLMNAGIVVPGSAEMVSRTLVGMVTELAITIVDAGPKPAARRAAERDARELIARILGAIRA